MVCEVAIGRRIFLSFQTSSTWQLIRQKESATRVENFTEGKLDLGEMSLVSPPELLLGHVTWCNFSWNLCREKCCICTKGCNCYNWHATSPKLVTAWKEEPHSSFSCYLQFWKTISRNGVLCETLNHEALLFPILRHLWLKCIPGADDTAFFIL